MSWVEEGRTRLWIPGGSSGKETGPGTKRDDAPFYNPAMALNRDLSVCLLGAELARRDREIDVADVLAGTGARTLRWGVESAGDGQAAAHFHSNDADPTAVRALHRAWERNGLPEQKLTANEGPARLFLARRRYDVVDIDPYGSPMPFLDAAMQATRHDGLLCLTATDTGALAGTYPKVCRRRYGAEPLHDAEWRAEVGLRILLGCAVRSAGRFDRGVEPAFSIAAGHWSRVVVRVRDGRQVAQAAASQMGHLGMDDLGGAEVLDHAGQGSAGPLWTGALHDADLVGAMHASAVASGLDRAAKVLEILQEESDAPPGWLPLPALHARFGLDTPRRKALVAALEASGARCWPAHNDPGAVRTDASQAQLEAAWRVAQRAASATKH